MRSLRRVQIAVVALSVGLLGAACGGDDSNKDATGTTQAGTQATSQAGSSTPTTQAGKAGGVLRVGLLVPLSGPATLDPAKMPNTGHWTRANLLFGTLLKRSQSGAFEPFLAESVTVTDPQTLKVVLRPNLKFSDGSALTADAVKATFQRNLASNNANSFQLDIMKLVSDFVIDSPTQFTLKLTSPSSALMYVILAGIEFAPLAPAQFSQPDIGGTVIAAGPMMLKSFSQAKVTFVKNPNFFRAAEVKLDGVEWISLTPEAIVTALRANQVDLITGQGASYQGTEGLSSPYVVKVQALAAPEGIAMCLAGKPPLDNVKVRQAISYALDRTAFNQTIWGGKSEVAWDIWPKDSVFYNKDLENYYARDLTKAKALLTEAGFPNGVDFNMIVATDKQRQGELVQAQLLQANIRVKLVVSAQMVQDFFMLKKEPSAYSQNRPGIDKISRFYLKNSFANICMAELPGVADLWNKFIALPLGQAESVKTMQQLTNIIVKEQAATPLLSFVASVIAYNGDKVASIDYDYTNTGIEPDVLRLSMK